MVFDKDVTKWFDKKYPEKGKDQTWIPAKKAAEILWTPQRNILSHIDKLKEGVHFHCTPFPTAGGKQKGYVFSESGLDELAKYIQTPEAKEYLSKRMIPHDKLKLIDERIDTLKQMLAISEQQKEQQQQIESHDNEIENMKKSINELTDHLININKAEARDIQNTVNDLVVIAEPFFPKRTRRQIYQSYYGIYKDWFNIPRYDELPKGKIEEAQEFFEALKILTESEVLDLNGYITIDQLKILMARYNLCQYKQV